MNNIQVISALPEEWGDSHCDNLSFSGCGKINATIKTMQIIKRTQPKLIINYGTGASKNYSGFGNSKKNAEQNAAKNLLKSLNLD